MTRIAVAFLCLLLTAWPSNTIPAWSFSLPPRTNEHRPTARLSGTIFRQLFLPAKTSAEPRVVCYGSKRPNESMNPVSFVGATITSSPKRSLIFSILVALAGAALGPLLDSFHSAFGVLKYDQPLTAVLWGSVEHPALITTVWVPELFGLAGFLISWLYILLDNAGLEDTKENAKSSRASTTSTNAPSPPKILIGISYFTFQYWLSGLLYHNGVDRSTILQIESLLAAAGFVAFDQSFAGFLTSTATALGGPLIEAGLLSMSRGGNMFGYGYHYSDLGETGFFPLWILPVYFLGGPAVGNLARGIWQALGKDLPVTETKDEPKEPPGCPVCKDTRQVPCPNCDGIGNYVATGGRTIVCTSCRGRGFVICRACFDYYDEDPNDVGAIRELVSRMPD